MIRETVICISVVLTCSFGSCQNAENSESEYSRNGERSSVADVSIADTNGIGKYSDYQFSERLDSALIANGEVVYQTKCASCHKLNNETLVGPGWKGSTKLYTAAWLMNFITNTDEMLRSNRPAQELLEIYTVKMPTPDITGDDAKAVVEFMRANDMK